MHVAREANIWHRCEHLLLWCDIFTFFLVCSRNFECTIVVIWHIAILFLYCELPKVASYVIILFHLNVVLFNFLHVCLFNWLWWSRLWRHLAVFKKLITVTSSIIIRRSLISWLYLIELWQLLYLVRLWSVERSVLSFQYRSIFLKIYLFCCVKQCWRILLARWRCFRRRLLYRHVLLSCICWCTTFSSNFCGPLCSVFDLILARKLEYLLFAIIGDIFSNKDEWFFIRCLCIWQKFYLVLLLFGCLFYTISGLIFNRY